MNSDTKHKARVPSHPPRTKRVKIRVERVGEEHRELLLNFHRREWDGGAGATERQPNVSIPQWLCLRGDEPIGYLGTLPARFRLAGRDIDGHWFKGLWVTQAYRAGPVGHLLVERGVQDLGFVGAHVVAAPARRLMESVGLRPRCTLVDYVRLLRVGKVLKSADLSITGLPAGVQKAIGLVRHTPLPQLAGAFGLGAWSAVATLADQSAAGLTSKTGWSALSTHFDELWIRLEDQVRVSVVRNAARLRDRYSSHPGYELVSVWRGEILEGWAVLRQPNPSADPRFASLRVALISDVFFPIQNPGAGIAAIGAAETLARSWGCDAVVCSGNHSSLGTVLSRRGYLPASRKVQVLTSGGTDDEEQQGAGEIWVTRGDARSDASF